MIATNLLPDIRQGKNPGAESRLDLAGSIAAVAQQGRLLIQRCSRCHRWQWGPEWICHHCHGFDLGFEEVAPSGRIYSFERVWHPVHRALADQGPYLVVLVELPQADKVRIVGNLLGDPRQPVPFGAPVTAVFEHHDAGDPPFTLLQWRLD